MEVEELKILYVELAMVQNMNEREACEYCGCDSKKDGVDAILEEIEYYESLNTVEEDDLPYTYGLDPAFSSWEEVNSMFI